MEERRPDRFPSCALPSLDGEARDLARPGRPTLVVLGHGACDTTRLLLPYLERIHRGRKPGTEAVLVLQDEPQDARALAGELGLTLPVLLDPEPWPLGRALAAHTVPLTIVVAPGGAIEHVWPAFRRADLERAAALFGVAPLFTSADTAPALRPG